MLAENQNLPSYDTGTRSPAFAGLLRFSRCVSYRCCRRRPLFVTPDDLDIVVRIAEYRYDYDADNRVVTEAKIDFETRGTTTYRKRLPISP
ncbi:hypothetical protein [Hydrocarboniphaga sp.]|uniref:hypothetical protein n=1 Tax=Hydrocarboniphaga sp. TaxID=2033016 RepID=UPI0026238CC6|nr:hypothetical protein [Hydrocarboniphaga sp.]